MKKKIVGIFVCTLLILGSSPLFISNIEATDDSSPEEDWNKTFGGANQDWGWSIRQTTDDGYIIAGLTKSYGSGDEDAWLIKTDSNGNKQWDKTFGTSGSDRAQSVQQTNDGGFIVVGWKNNDDVWLIKTDGNGNKQWDKTYGGSRFDWGSYVQQTSDGGYIITGGTWSYSSGMMDCWLIKTDASGNMEWNQVFGGSEIDHGLCVQQAQDGGYIVSAYTETYGMVSTYRGNIWLIKTDTNGIEEWNKVIHGPDDASGPYADKANSIRQTSDGGYILAGYEGQGNPASQDIWLFKTDSSGNVVWDESFGGSGFEYAVEVDITSDGGYVLVGQTNSIGAGDRDVWLIKTDSDGIMEWDKTFGGIYQDEGFSVQQTNDGGFIVTGLTKSFGSGNMDVWLIKIYPEFLPDLIVSEIKPVQVIYDSHINDDESIDLVMEKATVVFATIEIKNSELLDENTDVDIRLSLDGEEIDTITKTVSELKSNGQVEFNFIPSSVGDYDVVVKVDPEDAIPEFDENNNKNSKEITVKNTKGLYLAYLPIIHLGFLSDYSDNVTNSGKFISATYPLAEDNFANQGLIIPYVPHLPWSLIPEIGLHYDAIYVFLQGYILSGLKAHHVIGVVPKNYFEYLNICFFI